MEGNIKKQEQIAIEWVPTLSDPVTKHALGMYVSLVCPAHKM